MIWFDTPRVWKQVKNRQNFVQCLENKLQVRHLEDWYRISYALIESSQSLSLHITAWWAEGFWGDVWDHVV